MHYAYVNIISGASEVFPHSYVFRNIRTTVGAIGLKFCMVLLKVIMSVTDHGGKCVYSFTNYPPKFHPTVSKIQCNS